ncbi:MAG: hypothetical protein P1U34_08275 [Coxiellaceae bacterium]|nr:hypothetical protein [Coxiellaceae bacterium]
MQKAYSDIIKQYKSNVIRQYKKEKQKNQLHRASSPPQDLFFTPAPFTYHHFQRADGRNKSYVPKRKNLDSRDTALTRPQSAPPLLYNPTIFDLQSDFTSPKPRAASTYSESKHREARTLSPVQTTSTKRFK